MKLWPFLFVLLAGVADATLPHGAYVVDGGGSAGGNVCIVAGPPAYDYFLECEQLNASVLGPVNGSKYFFPSISPNVTFYVSGGSGYWCRYSVGGSWNNVSCSGGNVSEVVTLPEGWPRTLTFQVISGECNQTATVEYYVSYGKGNQVPKLLFLLLALIIPLIIVLILSKPVKSQRKRS